MCKFWRLHGQPAAEPPYATSSRGRSTSLAVARAMVNKGEAVNAVDEGDRCHEDVRKGLCGARRETDDWIEADAQRTTSRARHCTTLRNHAAKMGNVEMCKTLVELGTRADKKDRFGRTPLEVARAQFPGSEGNVLDKQLVAILEEQQSGVETGEPSGIYYFQSAGCRLPPALFAAPWVSYERGC